MILGDKIIEWSNIGQGYPVEIGALNVKRDRVAATQNMLLSATDVAQIGGVL